MASILFHQTIRRALGQWMSAVAVFILVALGTASPSTAQSTVPDSIVAIIAGDTLTETQFADWYSRSARAINTEEATAQPGSGDAVDVSTGPESPQDFLARYIDFRLKVRAARDAGLDTLASLQQEIASYRRQIARPTLMDEQIIGPLVREMYERRKEEVDVSHILIAVDDNAAPEDTMRSYRKLQAIVDSLQRGASFSSMARAHSDDPSASRENGPGAGGRLGYMTAGRLVKPFEDEMYATEVGERSNVFRTQYGYHVLKVHDRRERPAPVRIAHILITPSSPQDSATARATADSLLTLLREDKARFDSLAVKYSDDKRSAQRGGELGVLQPNQNIPPSFRDAAFELEEAGDVSGIVKTRFGFHLIQLLERRDRPTLDEAYDQLKQQASRMPRVQAREQEVASQVLERRGASFDTAAVATIAYGLPNALDSLAQPLVGFRGNENTENNAQIATIGDSTYTIADLSSYVASTPRVRRQSIRDAAQGFMTEQALTIAAAELEKRDPDFRRRMQEYRDGLLLFEYMQRFVWTPATQDTSALRTMYREHPDRYRFPERVRVLRLLAPADSLLPAPGDTPSDDFADEMLERANSSTLVDADTLFLTDSASDRRKSLLSEEDGSVVGPTDSGGQRALLMRLGIDPARRMTFQEARSRVIRDYQDAYEQEVLSRLREEYYVETFPSNLPEMDERR